MGLFKPANQNGAPANERQLLEQKYNSARSNLLLVVAFTAEDTADGGDSVQ